MMPFISERKEENKITPQVKMKKKKDRENRKQGVYRPQKNKNKK